MKKLAFVLALSLLGCARDVVTVGAGGGENIVPPSSSSSSATSCFPPDHVSGPDSPTFCDPTYVGYPSCRYGQGADARSGTCNSEALCCPK